MVVHYLYSGVGGILMSTQSNKISKVLTELVDQHFFHYQGAQTELTYQLALAFLQEADQIGSAFADSYPYNSAELGMQLLRQAAEQRHTAAMTQLAERLLAQEDTQTLEEAKEWLLRAAEIGDIEAMWTLGSYILDGTWDQPREDGVYWLKQAYQRGHLAALYEWIGRLLNGDGIAPNVKEGERLLRHLADLGQLMAMHLLGKRLYEGRGLKENQKEGLYWLQRAANAGDQQAKAYLLRIGG
jgi:TPR repeat protein